jgi:hypothetical protein
MPKKKPKPYPSLRAAIVARVAERQVNTTELARLVAEAGGAVSRQMLDFYLKGRNDLSSAKVDALMKVLGLAVVPTE